jgi:hypothetical protein
MIEKENTRKQKQRINSNRKKCKVTVDNKSSRNIILCNKLPDTVVQDEQVLEQPVNLRINLIDDFAQMLSVLVKLILIHINDEQLS